MESKGFRNFFKRFGISSIMFIVFIAISFWFLLWFMYGRGFNSDVVWELVLFLYILFTFLVPLLIFVAQILHYYLSKNKSRITQTVLIVLRMIPTIVFSISMIQALNSEIYFLIFGLLSLISFTFAGVFEIINLFKRSGKLILIEEPVVS